MQIQTVPKQSLTLCCVYLWAYATILTENTEFNNMVKEPCYNAPSVCITCQSNIYLTIWQYLRTLTDTVKLCSMTLNLYIFIINKKNAVFYIFSPATVKTYQTVTLKTKAHNKPCILSTTYPSYSIYQWIWRNKTLLITKQSKDIKEYHFKTFVCGTGSDKYTHINNQKYIQ